MPIARKNIPQDFLDQMKSNLTINEDSSNNSAEANAIEVPKAEIKESIESPVKTQENSPVSVPSNEEEKKDKYADVMNIRLSKGRRNEIKTFCSGCGVSVTQYIETSFEYLQNEVAAGRIVISKGGIKKVE